MGTNPDGVTKSCSPIFVKSRTVPKVITQTEVKVEAQSIVRVHSENCTMTSKKQKPSKKAIPKKKRKLKLIDILKKRPVNTGLFL